MKSNYLKVFIGSIIERGVGVSSLGEERYKGESKADIDESNKSFDIQE